MVVPKRISLLTPSGRSFAGDFDAISDQGSAISRTRRNSPDCSPLTADSRPPVWFRLRWLGGSEPSSGSSRPLPNRSESAHDERPASHRGQNTNLIGSGVSGGVA